MSITYKKCSEVEDRFIFQAFMDGFSDYIVKFQFEQEDFILRFFGPEGNSREISFIAFDEEQPVGVILGGIKTYESIKTMRCGTLAIHPEYRGRGVSQHLFKLHKEEADRHGCKQLFLEVIVGNDRAIHFYKKLGYEKIYDIVYYSNSDLSKIESNSDILVEKIDFASFKKGIETWNYHINWQNDLEFIAEVPATHYYGAFEGSKLKGALAIQPSGNINFLMVDKNARGKGIGTQLLSNAASTMQLSRLSVGFPNNSLLEGFLKKNGFVKGSLSQYEMYRVLS
jgi:ribosomal protein S18 acetylase RimI-like enzyme